MNIINRLTELQKQYMDASVFSKERELVHESWFDESTTDFWRHRRMYESIRPLADLYAKATWLTVGDGRFGLDAIRLKKLFALRSVFPTDIGENMLKLSKEKGLIDDYGVENAERLSFSDGSFDVVFCKEAFHHLPRPYLALYEMLRVSKKAVVLIEPAERIEISGVKSVPYLFSAVKLLLSKLVGKAYRPFVPPVTGLNHAFEEAGNYLYSVSVREMEKLVHGLNLGGLAWKGLNDVYMKGCEFEKAAKGHPLFDQISTAIARGDELCKAYPQFHQPNMVSLIFFKESPDRQLVDQLNTAGFCFPAIQRNPYLGSNSSAGN